MHDQSPVGVREVDVGFSFFVVGTRKICFVMNLIVQNLTNLAVTFNLCDTLKVNH